MEFHTPFAFFVCQHGAEGAAKGEVCQPNGPYRLAFSTPGFVTLKGEMRVAPWSKAMPQSPWIRMSGHAHESMEGGTAEELIDRLLGKYGGLDWEYLHVWQRDEAQPGWNGFEPGGTALTREVEGLIRDRLVNLGDLRSGRVGVVAERGGKVLDCILVEPNRWWVGSHRVERVEESWPGGVYPVERPERMISRAYLKVAEAIAWSEMPIEVADQVVEIGSSPGGACQRLLEMGCLVTGVDPAEMDPWLLEQANFQHWRAKSMQVKRRLFDRFRWLFCDANVAPNYTLDAVGSIVEYPSNEIEGVVLTIKMADWEMAKEWRELVSRLDGMGFDEVKVRQLAFSRQEFCVAGLRL